MHTLDDVAVVTIEQAVAAPFATRHLADLGARVIKVERPDGGDFARASLVIQAVQGPDPGSASGFFRAVEGLDGQGLGRWLC